MAHGDARGHQRLLEGKGAADEEAHIPVLPIVGCVGELLGEHTVLIHPVAGDVGDDVAALSHGVSLRGAPDDLQHRTGEGVLLGVLLKVVGVLGGQNHQVGLGVAPAHAGGGEVDDALADELSHLRGLFVNIRGNVKGHSYHPFCLMAPPRRDGARVGYMSRDRRRVRRAARWLSRASWAAWMDTFSNFTLSPAFSWPRRRKSAEITLAILV